MQAIFMIGEQRSGSNLLRLMLNQSARIAAPHPPHILQRFNPLLPMYGDLSDDGRFGELVDDVCRLVELNPVRWEGVDAFDRGDVLRRCRRRSLVAVYGAVMDIAAEAQGKEAWLCKSMQNVRWASDLDGYFAEPRYVYLYRDVRDVVLSFRKAVVGEKHGYFIARQWAELQRICIRERRRIGPERSIGVRYEDLITDPERTLRGLCAFLGAEFSPSLLAFHESGEASRTAQSSSLWENVRRPVMADNSRKFLRQMSEEDVRIVESVTGDVLDELGYERVFVPKGEERVFTPAEIAAFARDNERLKKQTEVESDPDDAERRRRQLAVLDAVRARYAKTV